MSLPFADLARVDAHDKVRGAIAFAADDVRPDLAHGAFAVATIGKGRLTSLDTAAAEAAEGVRLVLTHATIGAIQSAGFIMGGGYGFEAV